MKATAHPLSLTIVSFTRHSFLLLVLVLMYLTGIGQTTVYVDATYGNDANNGNSWSTAYATLAKGLQGINTNGSTASTILVATGTYYPTGNQSSTDRDSAFTIQRGGIRLLGGYPAGGGTRNPSSNPVYLDGDIGTAASNTDNSCHVMVITSIDASADSVVVDGFTIRNGNANVNSNKQYIVQVSRKWGGGAALYGVVANKVVIRNCSFSGNVTSEYGGAIFNGASSPIIRNCIFTNNTGSYGGAIANTGGSAAYITNCTFSSNTATAGGGIYNDNSAPTINRCIISGNTNSGSGEGGGIKNTNASSLTISNSIISGNSTTYFGGGIANYSNSSITITNCIMAGNKTASPSFGSGGIGNYGSSTAAIRNCIIWDNIAPVAGSLTINYSIVQGGYSGTGNLNADPLFVNSPAASTAPFTGGDYRLSTGSPAINTGDSTGVSSLLGVTDLAGNYRYLNNLDMGAYEFNSSPPVTTLDKLGLTSTVAAGAYSLRLLNSAYTGPLVRIAIGSNFYDVYPDASTDKAFSLSSKISAPYSSYNATATGTTSNTLSSVVTGGVTNATGAIWYDQTDNGNDAYQPTTANQPQLISAGSVVVSSNRPSFRFTNSSTHHFQTSNNIAINGSSSINAVSQGISSGASSSPYVAIATQSYGGGMIGGALGRNGTSKVSYGIFNSVAWQNSSAPTDFPITPFIATGTYGGISLNLYMNGVASSTGTTGAGQGASRTFIIGKRWDNTDGYNGYIGEVVVFNSTLSQADRQAIEASQGTYYAIGVYSTNTDAHLSALTSTAGPITPSFDSSIAAYNASVSNATTSTTITPTVFINGATVKVNNVATTSGNASSSISLNVGANNIPVVVTALDGTTTKTYTVIVTRAASTVSTLSNLTLSTGTLNTTFASGTTSYTATLSNATSSITVTPTVTDATATVKVNTVSVVSGNASSAINLAVGTNTITVVGTAQDGTTTTTYTITVTRLAADVVYYHSFSTGSLTGNDYTIAPDVLSSNLTVGTPQWTGVNGTTFCAGNGGLSVSVPNIGSTRTMTLVLNVANGYKLNLTGVSFKQNSTINNGSYGIKVNGTGYASSSSVQNACPGVKLSGSTTLSLTGTVTIEVYGTNSGSGTQSLSIDDFTINGSFATTLGNALNFDGTSDIVYGTATSLPQGATARTVEGWVKIPNGTTSAMTLFNYGGYGSNLGNNKRFCLLASGGGGYIYLAGDNNDFNTNVSINDGKWHHIAVTYNGTTLTIYKDGISVGSTSKTFATVGNEFQIGGNPRNNSTSNTTGNPWGEFLQGSVEEIRVWNTARSQSEIQANMFSFIDPTTSGLLVYYNFNQGVAGGTNTGISTLNDQTPNANNGTLSTFALSSTSSNWIASTAFNKWLGSSSAAYSTATNWELGTVPTTNDNIVIPTGASNLPVAVTAAQGFFNGMVQTGASLTNTSTLSIAGSLYNSGTITSTAGTVAYTGSTAQSIAASTFASNTVQGLTINNAAGVTLGGALTVTDVLTPTTGSLSTGGFLTLASSAAGTARVAAGTGTYISGNATVQRYIPGGRRVYRFLSHPFNSNLSLSSLTDNIDITGVGGTPMTTTATNNPSAYRYDNSIGDASLTNDPGWTALTASSTFNAKTGYRILVRGSKGQTGSLTGGTYTPDPVTLDWTGVLNQGSQVVTLTNNGTNKDYTLIGNPFASPVDLSLITRGSNINANFSVWNANAGSRGAYVTQAFSSSYLLPSGASFFTQVAANTNNTITFTEASKSSGTPSSLFRNNSTDETLTLEVNDANGNYADQLGFFFNSKEYTANNDALWDAAKMTNPDVNLYSFSKDGNKLAIDRRPATEESIALGFVAAIGNYNIVVKQLPGNNEYYLRDNYLGTSTLLTNSTTINIAVIANTASYGNSRFELVMKTKLPVLPIINPSFTVTASPNPVADILTVNYAGLDDTESSNISLVSMEGKVVKAIALGNVKLGKQSINVKSLPAGVYNLQLVNGNLKQSTKIIKE